MTWPNDTVFIKMACEWHHTTMCWLFFQHLLQWLAWNRCWKMVVEWMNKKRDETTIIYNNCAKLTPSIFYIINWPLMCINIINRKFSNAIWPSKPISLLICTRSGKKSHSEMWPETTVQRSWTVPQVPEWVGEESKFNLTIS